MSVNGCVEWPHDYPLMVLSDTRLRRNVFLWRCDDFVEFGLRIIELEEESMRTGQASVWPDFEEFMDAQVDAALGARASDARSDEAKRTIRDAVRALHADFFAP